MSSSEVFQQAVAWYAKCKCANPQPTWHPTRLIDLRRLKTRVQVEGTQTIVSGRRRWETLDGEVVRLVQKGDEAFPHAEVASQADDTNVPQNVTMDHPSPTRDSRRKHNRYVTLSHCWGEHRPLVLSEMNIDDLKHGIKMGDLPTTYRQAIQFASQMEDVGWIWIDSLCIIQGDETDWTHESSDMQRVYKESFLNISATAAHDSTEGIYCDRMPKTLWEDEVSLKIDGIQGLALKCPPAAFNDPASSTKPVPAVKMPKVSWPLAIFQWLRPMNTRSKTVARGHSQSEVKNSRDTPPLAPKGVRRCTLINVSHWDDLVDSAPVNVRAWVLQERLLAPRVLHFSKGLIAWECSEFEESEGYPAGIPKYILRDDRLLLKPLKKGLVPEIHGKQLRDMRLQGRLDPDIHLEDIYAFELWSRIVEDYSRLSLTECKDKLVALSGIAEFMAREVIGSNSNAAIYHAGLWDKHLASQLLWKVDPVFDPNSRTFHHPTRRPRDGNGKRVYRAPSFSWASLDAQYGNGITYGEITEEDLLIEIGTEENSVSTTCKVKNNLYGQVQRGHVMIWCKLRRIKLSKAEEGTGRFCWHLEDRNGVCRGLQTEEHRNVYLDCPEDDEGILDADDVYCVPAALGSRTEHRDSKYVICLLLQHIPENDDQLSLLPEDQRHGVYRRIGLTKLSTWADKLAYLYIQETLNTDIDYPQQPHKYGSNGNGRSLICII